MKKRAILITIMTVFFISTFIVQLKAAMEVKEIERLLCYRVHNMLIKNQLARKNGYIYTVDIGQLMTYFAESGDLFGYLILRNFAEKNLIINKKDDPYTGGFVLWRYKEGEKPDASGTTEALRIAKALWYGAQSFKRPQDEKLAMLIVYGYSRHGGIDNDVWIIKNYFNFATRGFATNSFLVDYDPDFLRTVTEKYKDPALLEIKDKSYELVIKGISPCGLFYDIIQPEVKTLFPALDMTVFSPNDIVQMSNSCTIADTIAIGEPRKARIFLNFASNRINNMKIYYYGRTGEPLSNNKKAYILEYSGLVRLSSHLKDKNEKDKFLKKARPMWENFARNTYEPRLYIASDVLLAISALKSFDI